MIYTSGAGLRHTHATRDIKTDGSCPRCMTITARWAQTARENKALKIVPKADSHS